MDSAFLANTTGTPKCWAATAAIPMPEASMVSTLVMEISENSRFHSLPISLNKSMSI